jgi:hypothetical protein
MATQAERFELLGSTVRYIADHEHVGSFGDTERGAVALYLKRAHDPTWLDEEHHVPVAQHRTITPAFLGPDPAGVEAVKRFAAEYGLSVERRVRHSHVRAIVLSGIPVQLCRAFGMDGLARFRRPDGREYIGRRGPITLPAELAQWVVSVTGIGDEQYRPVTRASQAEPWGVERVAALAASHPPRVLIEAYGFPRAYDGTGINGVVVALGPSWIADEDDPYLASLGLKPPSFTWRTAVHPEGDGNAYPLDLELACASAPGASWGVCGGLDTYPDLVDTMAGAIYGEFGSVITCGWTGPESDWPAHCAIAMRHLLEDAAALAITVVSGSGDPRTDAVPGDVVSANLPGCSPFVWAAGGSTATIIAGRIAREVPWSVEPVGDQATGHGASWKRAEAGHQFAVGTEAGASGRYRPTPDAVLAATDHPGGYLIVVDGVERVFRGTGASSAMWAGLFTRCQQALVEATGHRVGWFNPYVYAAAAAAARDGVPIFNRVFDAEYPGAAVWRPRVGLGSPNAAALPAWLIPLVRDGVPAAT